MQAQAKEYREPLKAEKSKKGFSPRAFRASVALLIL